MKFSSFLIFAIAGILWVSPALTQNQSHPDDQLVRDQLISLAGAHSGDADCGSTDRYKPDPKVSDCVKAAFQGRKPFYFLASGIMAMSPIAYGLAGDAAGSVSVVEYNSRVLLNLGAEKRSQLFDGNRIRVTSCVRPIKLVTTEAGLVACAIPVNEEESQIAARQQPVDTSVCAILEHPSAFNNKLVRIHGYASGNFEYSDLGSDQCSAGLWFTYGNAEGPPGLVAWVVGGARPGAEDAEGRLIRPVPVKWLQDSNFARFQKLMAARARKDARSLQENADPLILYRVSATFTGRIDAVSDDVHEFHLKRTATDRADFLGFGQMGLFDAQFVMQSVEGDAVLEQFPPEPNPAPQKPQAKP